MGNVMRPREKVNKENLDGCPKDDNMMVVLRDYPAPEVSEPIYRMGERLRVITEDAYCCRVRSVQTGTENYIPLSHVGRVYHDWLFEGVGRQKAEELLLLPGNGFGSFLVRQSLTERGVYALSVKHRLLWHYRISRLDNSWYYISPRLTFQCLEDMINHYSETADGLCCALTSPCLSAAPLPSDATPLPLPVVMRQKFDWDKVDRRQLVRTDSHSDNVVSYGFRDSLAAYLSLNEGEAAVKGESGKKRSKSVYAPPKSSSANSDYGKF